MRRRWSLRSSSRESLLDRSLSDLWPVIASGRTGPQWYVDAAPFVVRGAIDRLAGGVGRRWPAPGSALLGTGDRVGFWTVRDVSHEGPVRRLTLRADVRAPGLVELVTVAEQLAGERTRVNQTIAFASVGLLGAAYLLADLPVREAVAEAVHRRLLAALAA